MGIDNNMEYREKPARKKLMSRDVSIVRFPSKKRGEGCVSRIRGTGMGNS